MTVSAKRDKFPLWHHPRGGWSKKIRGRVHYFGRDKDAALAEYVRVRADLEAGRVPREKDYDSVTVRELVNRFLAFKQGRVDAGELSKLMWWQYYRVCEMALASFGRERAVSDLTPDDFGRFRDEYAARVGPYSVARLVQATRTLMKFAHDERIIKVPVHYGRRFDKPSATTFRKARADAGAKLIPAPTLRRLIDAAGPQLKAMILLGLNAGMTQSDFARLPRSAVVGHWLDFPRPKNGVARRAYLWPETVAALKEVRKVRPDPADKADAGLVFLTKQGHPWARFVDGGGKDGKGIALDAAGPEFSKLAARLKIKLPGRLRVLRKVYRTIADETNDRPAVDLTMGHTDPTVGAMYRERIDDRRLEAVAGHVREWLFGEG